MTLRPRGFWWDAGAALAVAATLLMPAGRAASGVAVGWLEHALPAAAAAALLCSVPLRLLLPPRAATAAGLLGVIAGACAPLAVLAVAGRGGAGAGLWIYVAGYTVVVWRVMAALAGPARAAPLSRPAVAGVFGLGALWFWEVVCIGFDVPRILLPPPSLVWARMAADAAVLWGDFRLTFFEAILTGYAVGCSAGFLFAVAVERRPFLARGLLPLGSAFSAIPIVAVAPIMIIWFGFGSMSKAAVIVLMTFFPMMVNTLAGLRSVDRMHLDLMHSWGAGAWTGFFRLRLPAALPFVFNALKINSTLAMIGAIVAEFFGTPLAGMGFRISASIGRLHLDMVWATIAVAALAGSLFYGAVALAERRFTFWHASMRR